MLAEVRVFAYDPNVRNFLKAPGSLWLTVVLWAAMAGGKVSPGVRMISAV
jgi:hypothetical protein